MKGRRSLCCSRSASQKTPRRFLESRRTRDSLLAPSTSQAGEVETAGARGFGDGLRAAALLEKDTLDLQLKCQDNKKELSLCEEILLKKHELEDVPEI